MEANTRRYWLGSAGLTLLGTAAVLLHAQTPGSGPILSLTATTQNITGANDSIRIDLLRWSTDAERDEVLGAWNMTLAPAPAAGGRGGRGGGGGARGGGGRGAGAAAGAAEGADAGAAPAAAAAAGGGRGGRGGGGGGRGGRGGGAAADAPKPTPEGTLAAELGKMPTVGYLWSSEVAGYAIRYAGKLPSTDGSQHIILITDRRLGAWNDKWKLTNASASAADAGGYEFSVIELKLNAKDEGEGKASLAGKLAVDSNAKMLTIENYESLPVVLKSVKRKS